MSKKSKKSASRAKKAASSVFWLGRVVGAVALGWAALRVIEVLMGEREGWDPDPPPPSEPRAEAVVEPAAATANDLTQIAGIGPAFAAKLNQAGIATFMQVAELGDEQLAAILQPQSFQRPDYAGWRAQARELAATPVAANGQDDLTQINGIGPAFAKKLAAAGVDSFEKLGRQSPDGLQAILQAPEWRLPDYSAWIAQAQAEWAPAG